MVADATFDKGRAGFASVERSMGTLVSLMGGDEPLITANGGGGKPATGEVNGVEQALAQGFGAEGVGTEGFWGISIHKADVSDLKTTAQG